MTADDLAEKVAAVLGEHAAWHRVGDNISTQGWACTCGEFVDDNPSGVGIAHRHQAHLAAALLPLIREREAAAWAEVAFNAAHPEFQRFLARVAKRAHIDGRTEVRAHLERLADEWERADAGPDGLGYAAGDNPDPSARTAELRAALAAVNPYAGSEGAECDHPGIDHGFLSAVGICPRYHKCKFIGHGPLCIDCYGAAATEEGT